jgi:light-regulated signal transduction histidine kinase (bacteriophytochrome)
MLGQAPQLTEIDYICIAADLLTEMTSELQSLERDNRRVILTMAMAGHDLRARLHSLSGAVELLTSSRDQIARAELCQRAKALIFQLARELEQLALEAELDYGRAGRSPLVWAHPRRFAA